MEKPLDSKITIGVGDRGEDVVTIPPAGVSLRRLLPALPIALWLCLWALWGGWAVWGIITDEQNRTCLLWWLAGWLVGGVVAWRMLFRYLYPMFGTEWVSFDFGQVGHGRDLFGYRRIRGYPIRQISGFERMPREKWWGLSMTWHDPGPAAKCRVVRGKRESPVGVALTDAEADWLVEELNSLLARHRWQSS